MRQDFRETLPKLLAEQFSRELSKEEWGQLYKGLAKTDIAALERLSAEEIRTLLTDQAALDDEIAGLEEILAGKAPQVYRDHMKKADELAEFMVTGKVADNLLRNAVAISRLLGEIGQGLARPDGETIRTIDELTTLYALRKLDAKTRASLKALAETEAKGVDFLTHYLADLRRNEKAKPLRSDEDMTRINGWKGYIPHEARDGATLIVADDSEHNKLVRMGYTRLGEYKGAGTEDVKRSYYFSNVSGRATYQQGVMQTVQTSVAGVDPRTGRSLGGFTAGHVPSNEVAVIRSRLAVRGGTRKGGEPLIPRFDGDGVLVGFEFSMAPEMLEF